MFDTVEDEDVNTGSLHRYRYRILLISDALRQQFVLGSRGGMRHNEGNAVFRD